MTRKEYRSGRISVTLDPRRCIHSKDCVHGLPDVFDVEKRPWINPDNSNPDTIAEVVTRCPTGTLQFSRKDGSAQESVPEENVVTIARDGPLYVWGEIEIKEHDGSTFLKDTRVVLCRCGESRSKPFCDNSHRKLRFQGHRLLKGRISPGNPRSHQRPARHKTYTEQAAFRKRRLRSSVCGEQAILPDKRGRPLPLWTLRKQTPLRRQPRRNRVARLLDNDGITE